jgi:hypothetical protein
MCADCAVRVVVAREHDDTVRAALFYTQLLTSYCAHARVHNDHCCIV